MLSIRARRRVKFVSPVVCTGLLLLLLLWLSLGWGTGVAAASDARTVQLPAVVEMPTSPQTSYLTTQLASSNILTVALSTDVERFDPAALTDGDALLVTSQIYETLVNPEPGGSLPQPGLAESWTVSADGKTWTLNLRTGVTFHDGNVLDADAVVYNFERWWDPAHPFHQDNFDYFAGSFGGFKGDPDCVLTSVTASGPLQVQLVFKQKYNLASVLNLSAFAIASPAAIQSGTLNTNPVGSGPYRFVQHTPGGQVRLEANPSYWGAQPHIPNLRFQIIADNDERIAALQNNTVQVADMVSAQTVSSIHDPNLKVLWRPSMSIGYLGINRAHGPLDSLLVREAIAHAVNVQSLIDNYYPLGTQVAQQFLPPSLWGHDPSITGYTYDPELARSLLAQAGYPNGFTTTLTYRNVVRQYLMNPVAVAEAIHADLLSVGIDAQLVTMESGLFLDKVNRGELDLFLLGWGADYPHPDNFFYDVLCKGYLAFGPRDDVLCNQVSAAYFESFPAGQLAAYQTVARRVHTTLPLLPIAHARSELVTRADVAITPSAVGAEVYRDVFYTDFWPITAADGLSVTVTAAGVTTTLQLTPGAVTTNTVLVYTPLQPDTLPVFPLFVLAGHAFALDTFQASKQVQLTLSSPMTVVLDYTAANLSGIDPETVSLYYWNGVRWSNDGITVLAHDFEQRRLTAALSHLSNFALFGQSFNRVLLPFTVR